MKTISKSDFMMYCKHHALLWIKKNQPKLIPPVDEATQAMFDAGNYFEQFAESLFPGGLTLGFADFDEYQTLPERTLAAIESGEKTLFQARFEKDGFTCISDVIEIVGDKLIDLVEIKSSTDVKTEHIVDLSFQTAVIESCGFTVRNISVYFVNNQYVRNGEVEANELVSHKDVTAEVRKIIEQTKSDMPNALAIANQPKMPDPSPRFAKQSALGEYMETYRNLVDLPENSIYDLCRIKTEQIGELEDLGIKLIKDISNDFTSNTKQLAQIQAVKAGKTIVDKSQIQNFLNSLEYPLFFFDYETLAGVVPYFDRQKPYQQVPFQYSLHVLRSPDGELEHLEYLHSEKSNPVRPLAEQLIQDLGSSGSIITWNKGFEMGRNRELGEMMPEYAKAMADINDRVVDLMTPFSAGWYVDAKFKGSASIKNVLPVLSDLSYKDLGINNGSQAQRDWMAAVLDGTRDDKEQILADLREYCGLDTYAMVEIFNKLREITDDQKRNI